APGDRRRQPALPEGPRAEDRQEPGPSRLPLRGHGRRGRAPRGARCVGHRGAVSRRLLLDGPGGPGGQRVLRQRGLTRTVSSSRLPPRAPLPCEKTLRCERLTTETVLAAEACAAGVSRAAWPWVAPPERPR